MSPLSYEQIFEADPKQSTEGTVSTSISLGPDLRSKLSSFAIKCGLTPFALRSWREEMTNLWFPYCISVLALASWPKSFKILYGPGIFVNVSLFSKDERLDQHGFHPLKMWLPSPEIPIVRHRSRNTSGKVLLKIKSWTWWTRKSLHFKA